MKKYEYSGVNKNGHGRFRTEANNPEKQFCYFNGQNSDQMFRVFLSTRINKQENEKGIYFQIDRVKSKMNEDAFKANTLLRENDASNDSSKKFGSGYQPSENSSRHDDNDVQVSKEEKETVDRINQDFSQGDNYIKIKKKAAVRALSRKRYSTSKIKSRNFLTNIAYRRCKTSDFNNGSFFIDVYSFLLQNLYPLMIDRKFDSENHRQCVKMLWQKCLLQQYIFRYIFLYDNFLALTQMEITYQKLVVW